MDQNPQDLLHPFELNIAETTYEFKHFVGQCAFGDVLTYSHADSHQKITAIIESKSADWPLSKQVSALRSLNSIKSLVHIPKYYGEELFH